MSGEEFEAAETLGPGCEDIQTIVSLTIVFLYWWLFKRPLANDKVPDVIISISLLFVYIRLYLRDTRAIKIKTRSRTT